MANFQRLIEEHDRIDGLARKLQRMVEPESGDVDVVLVQLAELSAALVDHMAEEDSFIYPHMIAGKDHSTSRAAQDFVDEFADLTHAWAGYLERWTAEAMAADWQGFRGETLLLMGRLLERIRRENDLLYPTALKTGAIRLRAS